MVLDTGEVLLLLRAVDVKDRDKVGLVLKNEEGIITDWATI